jgi:AsmA-like C-terminal region
MLARLRKPLLRSLGVAIGLVVLLATAVLIAERLIESPWVRAQLTKKLSGLLNGQVSWQELHVRLLPLPHGVVTSVHVAVPNVVTANVARADVKIRLLPLFRGNVQVQSITLERPNVDVWISASAGQEKEKPSPLALYRSAMRPILDAAARFAPSTTVAIEDGRMNLHLLDLPPCEASKLNLRLVSDGRGVAVAASATGPYWDRLAIDGRVEFADLRSLIRLEGSGLKPQRALESMLTGRRESLVVSEVGARLEARTDGHTDIEIAFGLDLPKASLQLRGRPLDIAQVRLAGSIQFIEQDIAVALDEIQLGELAHAARMRLRLSGPKRAPKFDITIGELDLARLRDATMILAADHPELQEYIARIHGGRLRDLRLSTQADGFAELLALSNLHGSAQLADGSMQVPTLEREASNITAHAELVSGVIKVDELSARLGASLLRQAGMDIVLLKPMRIERTRGQATIELHDMLTGLRARKPLANLMRSIRTLTGVAEIDVRSLALRFGEPSRVGYDLSVRPQHIRIGIDKLPDAAIVHRGTLRVTPESVNADRVGIEMLGSTASVSGELTGFRGGNPRLTARIADGVVERKLIDWIWPRTALAERLKPATPLRFTAQRVQWSDAGLDVVATANISAGPSLSIDLSTRDKTFALRRASIKDRESDAVISYTMRESLVEVGFAGVLAARSLAPLWGRPAESWPGSVSGDIQATIDLTPQGRTAVRGRLAGGHFDLRSLTGTPVKLERFDMQGDGNALQIRELTMDWAEQNATIRGAFAHGANGLETTLEIDSPGIVVDALRGTPITSAAAEPAEKKNEPRKSFDLWPLPLNGTVSLRTDFVEYLGYRVQGVRAVATLARDTVAVNVTEASLCGVTFPLSLRMTPKEFDATANVTTKNQSLEDVVQCLGEKPLIITGNINMTSVLTAKTPTEHIGESLVEHLAGSVSFSARDGEIRKMEVLSKILSLKPVRALLKGDAGLGGHGLKYRRIEVGATIENGELTLEQAALDSPELGLAAAGSINLENYDSHLTVLVAPFGRLDRIVRKMPILGYVIGGAFTSVPVAVTGDIRKPIAAPLQPRAVGSEVMDVFKRTFRLPGKIVELPSTPTK